MIKVIVLLLALALGEGSYDDQFMKTDICGLRWNRTDGVNNLNIEDITDVLQLYCPAMNSFHESYLTNGDGTGVYFVLPTILEGQTWSVGLSSVRFDLYAEMFHSKSTTLEIAKLDAQWVEPLRDYLVDLREMPEIDLSNVNQKWIRYDLDGRLLGIPVSPNQITMYYRKDLFDKYNHKWKHDSWENFESTLLDIQTRERQERVANGLDDDFWGFTIPTDDSSNRMTYMLISLLSGHDGGGIVEEDGTVTINNPNAIKAMQRWASWFNPDHKYNIVSPSCFGQGTSGATDFFLDGKSAAIIVWTKKHSGLMREKLIEDPSWDIRAAPIPGKNAAGCSGDWSLSLSRYTRNRKDAARWLQLISENLIETSMEPVGKEPIDLRIQNDTVLWERYCSVNPIICKSYEEYPEWWKKMSFRPSRGCGSLYPQCASAIYKSMYSVFQGVPAADAAASMERDLNVLLGHWEPGRLSEYRDPWKSESRIALLAVSGVSLFVLVLLGLYLKSQTSKVAGGNKTSGVPISVLLGAVVTLSLGIVMSVVIIYNDSNMRDISDTFGESIRVQSLLSVRNSVSSTITSMAAVTSSKTVSEYAAATMKVSMGEMQLDSRSLVLLIDRNFPNKVLVSSDPLRQKERIPVGSPEQGSWLTAVTNQLPNWDTAIVSSGTTMSLDLDGTVLVNMETINHEMNDRIPISYLIIYMIPEKVVMEDADRALDNSLNIGILLSISAILAAILLATRIGTPIITLARDLEDVKLMKLERLKTEQCSSISEMNALLSGFDSMCRMLKEYKTYVPSAVLVGSTVVEPPRGEAAIVFTDIAESTLLWDKSPVGMNASLEIHNDTMRELLSQYSGYEVKTIGDAFMIAFGSPPQALSFCLTIQDSLNQKSWPPELDLVPVLDSNQNTLWNGLRVRIGCQYGEVIVENNPLTGRVDYRGTTVNKASRLEGKALPGTICIAADLRHKFMSQLKGSDIPATRDFGSHSLKGLGDDHHLILVTPKHLSERLRATSDQYEMTMKSPNVNTPHSGQSFQVSVTSSIGRALKVSKTGLSLQTGCVTLAVCKVLKAYESSGESVFDKCHLMLRGAIDSASETEGVVANVTGVSVTIAWNASKKCLKHTAAGVRFASLLERRLSKVIVCGVSTGTVFHGNVGTQKQRFHTCFGRPLTAAEAAADHASSLQLFCVVADCSTNSEGFVNSPLVVPFLRAIDVWIDTSTTLTITLYEALITSFANQLNDAWQTYDSTATEIHNRLFFDIIRNGEEQAESLIAMKLRTELNSSDAVLQIVNERLQSGLLPRKVLFNSQPHGAISDVEFAPPKSFSLPPLPQPMGMPASTGSMPNMLMLGDGAVPMHDAPGEDQSEVANTNNEDMSNASVAANETIHAPSTVETGDCQSNSIPASPTTTLGTSTVPTVRSVLHTASETGSNSTRTSSFRKQFTSRDRGTPLQLPFGSRPNQLTPLQPIKP